MITCRINCVVIQQESSAALMLDIENKSLREMKPFTITTFPPSFRDFNEWVQSLLRKALFYRLFYHEFGASEASVDEDKF